MIEISFLICRLCSGNGFLPTTHTNLLLQHDVQHVSPPERIHLDMTTFAFLTDFLPRNRRTDDANGHNAISNPTMTSKVQIASVVMTNDRSEHAFVSITIALTMHGRINHTIPMPPIPPPTMLPTIGIVVPIKYSAKRLLKDPEQLLPEQPPK